MLGCTDDLIDFVKHLRAHDYKDGASLYRFDASAKEVPKLNGVQSCISKSHGKDEFWSSFFSHFFGLESFSVNDIKSVFIPTKSIIRARWKLINDV